MFRETENEQRYEHFDTKTMLGDLNINNQSFISPPLPTQTSIGTETYFPPEYYLPPPPPPPPTTEDLLPKLTYTYTSPITTTVSTYTLSQTSPLYQSSTLYFPKVDLTMPPPPLPPNVQHIRLAKRGLCNPSESGLSKSRRVCEIPGNCDNCIYWDIKNLAMENHLKENMTELEILKLQLQKKAEKNDQMMELLIKYIEQGSDIEMRDVLLGCVNKNPSLIDFSPSRQDSGREIENDLLRQMMASSVLKSSSRSKDAQEALKYIRDVVDSHNKKDLEKLLMTNFELRSSEASQCKEAQSESVRTLAYHQFSSLNPLDYPSIANYPTTSTYRPATSSYTPESLPNHPFKVPSIGPNSLNYPIANSVSYPSGSTFSYPPPISRYTSEGSLCQTDSRSSSFPSTSSLTHPSRSTFGLTRDDTLMESIGPTILSSVPLPLPTQSQRANQQVSWYLSEQSHHPNTCSDSIYSVPVGTTRRRPPITTSTITTPESSTYYSHDNSRYSYQ